MTSEPSALVATCGGYTGPVSGEGYTDSCLVLDAINQRWEENRMGSLTMPRYGGAVVRLDYIGVFIVGGAGRMNSITSEFLAVGTMQWEGGPSVPSMKHPCAVAITPTSFLAIYENRIREFNAAIAGPRSGDGWKRGGWPMLQTRRKQQPGCAKVGQKVIIAGGSDFDKVFNTGGELSSTEARF